MSQAYRDYRCVDYDWLGGTIPAHWQWLYLTQVADEQKKKNTGLQEQKVLSLSYGNIVPKKNIDFGLVPDSFETYQIVNNGNIIMRLTDLQNDHKSLRTGLVKERGIITSAYTCLKPRCNSAYLQYLLHSYDAQKLFYGLGGGVRQSIGYKEIRYINVPVPTESEQAQIVGFLDWKVSQINKLINVHRRQIELLQKQNQSVINQEVTRCDSGWKEIRLGNLGMFRKGQGGSREDDDDGGLSCIRYGDIYRTGKMSITEPVTRIKQEVIDRYTPVKKGEMLFALSGETKDEIGQALVNDIAEDTWTSGDTGIFTCNSSILPHFLAYSLRCPYIIAQRAALAKGDIIVHISVGALRQLRIFVPPTFEQNEIICKLDRICANVDKAASRMNKNISLLQEYRTRLISDVVFGKVDVRDLKVPEYGTVDETAKPYDNNLSGDSPEFLEVHKNE